MAFPLTIKNLEERERERESLRERERERSQRFRVSAGIRTSQPSCDFDKLRCLKAKSGNPNPFSAHLVLFLPRLPAFYERKRSNAQFEKLCVWLALSLSLSLSSLLSCGTCILTLFLYALHLWYFQAQDCHPLGQGMHFAACGIAPTDAS